MRYIKIFKFVVLFFLVCLKFSCLSAQEPPDIRTKGNVINQKIVTESGYENFLNNLNTVDGSNFTKVFGKTAFNTTLYHNKRRQECYKKSLLVACQLPVLINPQYQNSMDEMLKKVQKFADGSGKFIDFWDNRQTNYRSAEDLAAVIDNFISKYLRKINPKSHGGVAIQTRNLQELSKALTILKVTSISIDFAFNAAVREALATDEAITRLGLIESILNDRQRSGIHVDPVMLLAIQDAKETIETADNYYGALLMEMSDRRNELISLGTSQALAYIKKHYATQALTKYFVKQSAGSIGSKAALTKATAVTGLWTWSIMLTYETIDALLDQHEKMQTGIVSATLSSVIKEEIVSGRIGSSDIINAMIWQLEYMYYDQMVKVHSGFLPDYRDFVDKVIYGEKYNEEWRTEYTYLRDEELKYLLNLNLFDFPAIEKPSKQTLSLGFILDSSSSMTSSDPQDVRKSGVKQIVDLLTGDENIFLIDFDDRSTWLNPNGWKKWDRQQLKTDIDKINSSGNTNVGLGISTMQQAMEQSITDFSNTAVVLLSDGMGSYNNEAEWFLRHGIKIYTISYKDKADANMLNNIASSTGGLYFQANNESDVVAAFMQFNNDLQGLNKYISYHGTMNGSSLANIPAFFSDFGTKILTAVLSWSGPDKLLTLFSPSGIKYNFSSYSDLNRNYSDQSMFSLFDNSGDLQNLSGPYFSDDQSATGIFPLAKTPEWIKGPSYMIVKIPDAEEGQWSATVTAAGNLPSDDTFLFEATGSSDVNLPLDLKKTGGIYSFKLLNTVSTIKLPDSRAEIKLLTPTGKVLDISSSYKAGNFQFYPADGIGNYQVDAKIVLQDALNHTYQRQFLRSILVGEILPGYLAPVKETIGTYLITEQGTITGNRPGIKCFIYAPGGSASTRKATGIVTHVNERECTIRITDMLVGKIEKGDMVELDMLQWQNDKK